jgi:serine/threonine protein kinase
MKQIFHYLNFKNFFKYPIFSSAIEQLTLIMNVVGYPNQNFLHTLQQKPEVVEYLERLPNKPARVDFKRFFTPHISTDPETFDLVVDLFEKIFQLDPKDRITSKEALEHPFFSPFHDPDDEPDGEVLGDHFEYTEHTLSDWKSKIIYIS